jgi:hypothetical protein
MRLICFECHKEIDPRSRYFEIKVLAWHQNRGQQIHGYVYHAEHFPLVGGVVTAQVT